MEKIYMKDTEANNEISSYFRKISDIVDLKISYGNEVILSYSKTINGETINKVHFLSIEEYLEILRMVLIFKGMDIAFIAVEKNYDSENNPYMIFTIYNNTLKRTRNL